jgi:hypothetical protein
MLFTLKKQFINVNFTLRFKLTLVNACLSVYYRFNYYNNIPFLTCVNVKLTLELKKPSQR